MLHVITGTLSLRQYELRNLFVLTLWNKKNPHFLLCEVIFYNLSHHSTTIDLWNKPMQISLKFLWIWNWIISTFHSWIWKWKATEILKCMLLFSGTKNGQGQDTNYQVLGKYLWKKNSSVTGHRKAVFVSCVWDSLSMGSRSSLRAPSL